jgi:hypothetical protein
MKLTPHEWNGLTWEEQEAWRAVAEARLAYRFMLGVFSLLATTCLLIGPCSDATKGWLKHLARNPIDTVIIVDWDESRDPHDNPGFFMEP